MCWKKQLKQLKKNNKNKYRIESCLNPCVFDKAQKIGNWLHQNYIIFDFSIDSGVELPFVNVDGIYICFDYKIYTCYFFVKNTGEVIYSQRYKDKFIHFNKNVILEDFDQLDLDGKSIESIISKYIIDDK